jgi:seryl-tRNA synthetase
MDMNSTEINTLLKELNNKQNTLTTLVDRRTRAEDDEQIKSIIAEFISIGQDLKTITDRLMELFKQP